MELPESQRGTDDEHEQCRDPDTDDCCLHALTPYGLLISTDGTLSNGLPRYPLSSSHFHPATMARMATTAMT